MCFGVAVTAVRGVAPIGRAQVRAPCSVVGWLGPCAAACASWGCLVTCRGGCMLDAACSMGFSARTTRSRPSSKACARARQRKGFDHGTRPRAVQRNCSFSLILSWTDVARLPRRRTTRVWKPNVFNKSFFSEVLGRKCVWSHGNAAELTLSFSLRHTPVSSPHAHRACVRVPIKVTARAIRCIDKAGGFDNYILNTKVQAVKGRGRRDDGTTG